MLPTGEANAAAGGFDPIDHILMDIAFSSESLIVLVGARLFFKGSNKSKHDTIDDKGQILQLEGANNIGVDMQGNSTMIITHIIGGLSNPL